jgi:glycosyltransferase involved in cell wall biosynthesis
VTATQTQTQTQTQTISLIIPVYNVAQFLGRCMDSVLTQSHSDLEIILIDDGSSDGSGALCDSYAKLDSRVSVLHTENRGLSAARNLGIEQAGGAYLGFVDSDDWLAPDMYEYLLGLLQREDADVAVVDYQIAGSAAETIRNPPERTSLYTGEDILTYYLKTNEYGVWMRLYKRQLFSNARFDEGRIYEDVVGVFRALKNARRMVVSNQKKYYYFKNPDGISYRPMSKKDFDLLYSGDQLVAAVASCDCTNAGPELQKLAETKRRRAYFTLLIRMAITGCDDQLDEDEVAKELRRELKKHYRFLMRSNMPPNRKLLMTLVCLNYKLVKRLAVLHG